jgi:hypothetical protein
MTKENPQTTKEFNEFIEPLIEEVKKEKEYDLTDKEARLTEAGEISYEYFYEEEGYQNCDGDPACFCFTLREGMEAGFTKHQVAGLISSLEAKGVIWIEHRDPIWEGPDLFWLSEDFVNFIARKNIAKQEAN